MTAPRLLAFSGSLRRDSYNHRLVEVAARGAREAGGEVTVIRLADFALPHFNEDDEAKSGAPEGARRFQSLLRAHDGVLIASPEYNSGYTAALKNALDWASRPSPDAPPGSCFTGKAAAILAASPGGLGGLRGLVVLRMLLAGLGMVVSPEQFALAKAHEAFTPEGVLRDERAAKAAAAVGAAAAALARRLKLG
jgi:NAD(P)H-dependent FMN reductase